MTVIEKKQLLKAKIDALQEAQLDEAIALLENIESKEQEEDITALLAYTNQKYAEVWRALA